MDSKTSEALEADKRVTATFKAWQSERNPEIRSQRKKEYESAAEYAASLWEKVGPDPLLSQLGKAQEVQDELEGH